MGDRADAIKRNRQDDSIDGCERFVGLYFGDLFPAMRCLIRAVEGPMSFVNISAGPEKVADG